MKATDRSTNAFVTSMNTTDQQTNEFVSRMRAAFDLMNALVRSMRPLVGSMTAFIGLTDGAESSTEAFESHPGAFCNEPAPARPRSRARAAPAQISRFVTSRACRSMNSRRGSTLVPMRTVKIRCASP